MDVLMLRAQDAQEQRGGREATHDPKGGEGRAASGTAAEDAKAETGRTTLLLTPDP